MGWVISATPRPLCPWEIELVTTVQRAGCAPWPVWAGVRNLAPTRDFFSLSLYFICTSLS